MKTPTFFGDNRTGERGDALRQGSILLSCIIAVSVFLSVLGPATSYGVEKKAKPPQKPVVTPVPKDIVINDANLLSFQKRAEDLFKKSDYENALKTTIKIHDYAGEVLAATKAIRGQYDKVVNNASTPQNDKEDLIIKSRALDQLIPRYTTIYEVSTFNLGYIYSKLGDTEKARKHLVQYLQMVPFSNSRDSQWVKAKTLLLELYSLEGEF